MDTPMNLLIDYHRWRMLNEQRVFGGICREDNQIFLELIPNITLCYILWWILAWTQKT